MSSEFIALDVAPWSRIDHYVTWDTVPRATVFAAPGFGMATPVEMFVFLAFLAVGILYAWRKGVLKWRDRPRAARARPI